MNIREHVFIFGKLNFIDLYRKTSHAVCFFLILPQFFKSTKHMLFVCFCLFGLVCFFPHVFAPWWPRKSLLKDPVSHSREGQHVAKWVCHHGTYSFKTSMKVRWKSARLRRGFGFWGQKNRILHQIIKEIRDNYCDNYSSVVPVQLEFSVHVQCPSRGSGQRHLTRNLRWGSNYCEGRRDPTYKASSPCSSLRESDRQSLPSWVFH